MSLFGNLFGGGNNQQAQQANQMAFLNAANQYNQMIVQNQQLDAGGKAIDKAFAGFDDGFYNKYRDSMTGYYIPQIDDQLTNAKNDLTFKLARAGTLNSTAAGDLQSQLAKQDEMARAGIYQKADSAVGNIKGQVAQNKAAAQNQLKATYDANAAATMATNSANQVQNASPDLSPLAGLFNIGSIGAANAIQGYNNPGLYSGDSGLYGGYGGNGGYGRNID